MKKARILVLASGDSNGGGSGFQELVEFSRTNPKVLDAEIVGVISNHERGGVFEKARNLKVDFVHWSGPFEADGYQHHVKMFKADFVMCSGWLKYVRGLDPRITLNIHPGMTNDFGGLGRYGHHVHESVIAAYKQGLITQSAVTMHYVTEEGSDKEGYDKGPIIFQFPILIRPEDTAETLAKRVNEKERAWQALVLGHVVNGHIWLEREEDDMFKVIHSHTGLNQYCPNRLWKIPQLH